MVMVIIIVIVFVIVIIVVIVIVFIFIINSLNWMENKLQEDKKDTGGSSTVLKEYLPEEKNFSLAKTSWNK